MLIDEVGDLGSGHFFACRCEAGDVSEHDGEHTFFGPSVHPALLNKRHDQSAGYVAPERMQTVEHCIEGSRQAIDFAKMAPGQGHHFIEIKIADPSRALRRTPDWACNGAGHERCDDQ
jgi:hypothetical protein